MLATKKAWHTSMSIINDPLREPDAKVRVFLECTTTWAFGGNTGIQRVVRNVITHARSLGRALDIACEPAVWKDWRWEFIGGLSAEPALGREWDTLGVRLLKVAHRWASASPYPFRNVLFDYRIKRFLRSIVLLMGNILATSRYRASGCGVNFEPGDVLFLLDSSWHVPIWPGVAAARRRGARVGIMLYDLVPVLMPEMCAQELVASFQRWIRQAVRHADFFVCISRDMVEECRRHLEFHFPELQRRRVPFDSVRLGAELDLSASSAEIRHAVREVFQTPGQAYISVGTIEPRKNHWYLLDAFDLAWTQGTDASLCIVGKKGWKCDHVLERIERHPQLGKRLFMFNDLSDGELKHCYGKARAAILPSVAEGFGLPVVEALSLGCRVWASDIPVLREVGGDYCLYFDLGSPQSLAELIMRDERGELGGASRPLAEFHWPDWQESCRELLQKILELGR